MIAQLESVKALLWKQWDPIGVNGLSGWPSDEYDAYAFEIFTRMKSGARESEIREYLEWLAAEHKGLSQSSGHADIAKKIMEIFEEPTE